DLHSFPTRRSSDLAGSISLRPTSGAARRSPASPTRAGNGSFCSTGTYARCARGPQSSVGRSTSSALERSDLLPRAGLSVRAAPAIRGSQPRAQLGRVLARSPRTPSLVLEPRDRLELLEHGPAPFGLSADQPRRPSPSRRGRTQPRTRGLRVASHERSSYLICVSETRVT